MQCQICGRETKNPLGLYGPYYDNREYTVCRSCFEKYTSSDELYDSLDWENRTKSSTLSIFEAEV